MMTNEENWNVRLRNELAVPSRFPLDDRKLSDDELGLLRLIKMKASELQALIQHTKHGRYQSLAMTSLEESVMWAAKEITG
jgi:hypothetical protein